MFVGHYAVALAAKAAAPRAPLWSLIGASQLLDIGFSGLIIGGVEKFRVDPTLPGNPFDLYDMPWTHSLPAALVWSLAAAAVARLFRLPLHIAAVIGAVVFSHWMLDFIVHRPDLLMWPGGPKVGLGVWNAPLAEMALEMGLLTLGGAMWVAKREDFRQTAWPAVLYLALLVGLAIMFALPSPPPDGPIYVGVFGLVLSAIVTALAWPVDRSWRPANAP